MNGPCMCGDPYCGRCGDPGRAAAEAAMESLIEDLHKENLSPDECVIALQVVKAAVRSARGYAQKLVKDAVAEERSFRS